MYRLPANAGTLIELIENDPDIEVVKLKNGLPQLDSDCQSKKPLDEIGYADLKLLIKIKNPAARAANVTYDAATALRDFVNVGRVGLPFGYCLSFAMHYARRAAKLQPS